MFSAHSRRGGPKQTGTALAQTKRKKPTIRKKATVVKPVAKPAVKLYTVDNGTVFRVRINDLLSSKTAKVGDTFRTTLTEPVYSNAGVVVMPVGTIVNGRVDTVTPAKKGGNPGQIAVSFVSVRLPDGSTRAINGSHTELSTKDAKSDKESRRTCRICGRTYRQ